MKILAVYAEASSTMLHTESILHAISSANRLTKLGVYFYFAHDISSMQCAYECGLLCAYDIKRLSIWMGMRKEEKRNRLWMKWAMNWKWIYKSEHLIITSRLQTNAVVL